MRYAVIIYSTETADDIGPVLVGTRGQRIFYPVGASDITLEIVTFRVLKEYPDGTEATIAALLFYDEYIRPRPPEADTV